MIRLRPSAGPSPLDGRPKRPACGHGHRAGSGRSGRMRACGPLCGLTAEGRGRDQGFAPSACEWIPPGQIGTTHAVLSRPDRSWKSTASSLMQTAMWCNSAAKPSTSCTFTTAESGTVAPTYACASLSLPRLRRVEFGNPAVPCIAFKMLLSMVICAHSKNDHHVLSQ